MNRYETVFILTPVLSEEQAAETGKLAYPIQKKTTGFYYLMEFEAPGEAITPFETEFRRDERVLRFLTTAMDKFHMQYAESRRNKAKEKKETKAEA